MNTHASTHRRALQGALIVRVSLLIMGLVASMGLQLAEPEEQAPATWSAGNPSALCAVEAASPVGFQPGLQ